VTKTELNCADRTHFGISIFLADQIKEFLWEVHNFDHSDGRGVELKVYQSPHYKDNDEYIIEIPYAVKLNDDDIQEFKYRIYYRYEEVTVSNIEVFAGRKYIPPKKFKKKIMEYIPKIEDLKIVYGDIDHPTLVFSWADEQSLESHDANMLRESLVCFIRKRNSLTKC
jgi:hypothetical protein